MILPMRRNLTTRIIRQWLWATTLLSTSVLHVHASPSQSELKKFFQAGNYEQVIDGLDSVDDKTVEQHTLLISALLNTDLDDAEDAAETFIKAFPDDYRAYHMHASVMGAQASDSIFSALGYAEKAKNSLEKAVTIAPDNVAVYRALMQFHLAAPSIAGGDIDEAKKLAAHIGTMDETEGQFAQAALMRNLDENDTAKTILTALSEQPQSRARALFELGNLSMNDEAYDDAIAAYQPLLELNIAPANKDDEQAWEQFSASKFNQLYGIYRIGLIAVNTSKHTETGITALTRYLSEYDTTSVETEDLPSKNWARLRLTELFLNADNLVMAKQTIAQIGNENDKRFKKILKSLHKKIGKMS